MTKKRSSEILADIFTAAGSEKFENSGQ